MSTGINYSKFDKIQVSSSDEETVRRRPHVTTLDTSDKVVIGPDGLAVLKTDNAQETIIKTERKEGNEDKDKNKELKLEKGKINKTAEWETNKSQNKEVSYCEYKRNGEVVKKKEKHNKENEEKSEENVTKENRQEKERGQAERQIKKMLENGSVVPHEYIWSQSAHELFAHIVLPKNTKAKDLSVQIYDDRLIVTRKENNVKHTQEKTNNNGKDISNNNIVSEKKGCNNDQSMLINKMFPFKVCSNEDTQIWEIKNMKVNWKELFDMSNAINNQNNVHFDFENDLLVHDDETLLYISLKKVNEIGNSYIWWSSLFKGESQINVTKLPARTSANKKNNLSNFKNVWDQAHQIFKENISRKKLPIPLGE